jgi:hypothetical protein
MRRLLLFDFFRGPDSTGLAAIRTNGDAKIAKVASHPLDLFDMKKFTDALNGYQSRVFIGHNRLATKGGVNAVNAHPYHYGHIVGAHNGTLDALSWKELDEALGEKTDVDSQAIFMHMAKFGVEATISKLTGAWALVWYDQEEGTLNFLRNNQRPFWYAYNKECNRVFWASEWRTMEDAILGGSPSTANEHNLFEDNKKHTYFNTDPDWWYRFDVAAMVGGGLDKIKPKVKEVKGKEPPPVVNTSSYSNFPSPNRTTWTPTTHGSTGAGSTTTSSQGTANKKSVKDVIHLHGSTQNPLGGYMTKSQFDQIARYGCSWCTADVEFDEPGVLIIEKDQMILCPTCADTDHNHSRIYAEDFDKVAM